eukprot:11471375-Alexandrium_andersonii.AAC.1
MWSPTSIPARQQEFDFPILLPHELMAAMHSKYPIAFQDYVLGEDNAIAEFWASVKPNDPRLIDHPVVNTPGYESLTVPLRLHGDGVPFGRADGHSLD